MRGRGQSRSKVTGSRGIDYKERGRGSSGLASAARGGTRLPRLLQHWTATPAARAGGAIRTSAGEEQVEPNATAGNE